MSEAPMPIAIQAQAAPIRRRPSVVPEPFASLMTGRVKSPLGELFGLRNFGVNLVRMSPGSLSALRHAHSKQDEFIFVLEGSPTLVTNAGRTPLEPGMCAGFKAGSEDGHHLCNETPEEVIYLEVGDRTPGDEVSFVDDDLAAKLVDGQWTFAHKDGRPY